MKTKFAALVGSVGGLCALCCVLPIAGFFGLGALEAFFCDSPWAIGMGVGLMVSSVSYLVYRKWKKTCSPILLGASCSIGCGCKA